MHNIDSYFSLTAKPEFRFGIYRDWLKVCRFCYATARPCQAGQLSKGRHILSKLNLWTAWYVRSTDCSSHVDGVNKELAVYYLLTVTCNGGCEGCHLMESSIKFTIWHVGLSNNGGISFIRSTSIPSKDSHSCIFPWMDKGVFSMTCLHTISSLDPMYPWPF